MSSEPTARRVRCVSAWCSRSVHVIHVVADQEHSDCTVPRYWYMTELVWRFVMPTAHALDSTFNYKNNHVFIFADAGCIIP